MSLFADDIQVDDLQQALRLLRESRSGFLKLFETSPVCMSMTTTSLNNRVYARVNRRFIEIFGFTESELIGRNSVEVGILDQQESIRVGELIREKGRLRNDYIRCLHKSGKVVHTVSSIEEMDLDGRSYLVSFFVDVTQIFEQQEIIERHAKQLEVLNKDLESFSYSVSHDLRAPLRAIHGFAKVLEEDYLQLLDKEGKRVLTAILQNAGRMSVLIDDLLNFSRLGRKPIEKSDVDMQGLAMEVLDELAASVTHHAKVTIEPLHPVRGDRSLLHQVLVNLISNAIKYSSKKAQPAITISSKRNAKEITYEIADNGEGFDMKHADRLFGVFQRLHSAHQFEGTGVGLAIVHRIITRHDGTITAEGIPGVGATFRFTLPA